MGHPSLCFHQALGAYYFPEIPFLVSLTRRKSGSHNMRMKLPEEWNEDQALQELNPLTTALYDFLEAGVVEVIPWFHNRDLPTDERLATDMLRYEVRRRLKGWGIEVDMEEDVDLTPLPNNGIEGTFNGWSFKLLRSRNDEVPPPGGSVRRANYCSQQLRLIPLDEQAGSEPRPNTVILWNFDSRYEQAQLRLAVPREARGPHAQVACYFNVPVPHPALETVAPSSDVDTTEPDVRWKESPEVEHEEQVEQRYDP